MRIIVLYVVLLPLILLMRFTKRAFFVRWTLTGAAFVAGTELAITLGVQMLGAASDESGAEFIRDHGVPEELRVEVWSTYLNAQTA